MPKLGGAEDVCAKALNHSLASALIVYGYNKAE
jgi:hypothetical protein